MKLFRRIVTSLLFFQITIDLEQSGSRILDAFSLAVTFYLRKTELRFHSSFKVYTVFTLFLWVELPFLPQKCEFLQKQMLTSTKLKGSWYWKVYFLKINRCVNLRTKFKVFSIILTSFRQGVILLHSPYHKTSP